MSQGATVSVIISTFNHEKYIANAVDSVLAQTYKDYEILVVDDGSTDGTREVLEPYIKRGEVNYTYQKNKGAARARNSVIQSSIGKYLAFLDSDDTWFPRKLEASITYLEAHDKFGMVYTDFEVVDELGVVEYTCFEDKKLNAEGFILEPLLLECFIIPSMVVMRREVFDQSSGFREDLHYGEDYALWLEIARNHQVGRIQEPLARYLRHASNMTKNVENRVLHSARLAREIYPSVKDRISLETNRKFCRQLSNLVFNEGFLYFSRDQFKKSRPFFLESLKYWKFHPLSLCYYPSTYLPVSYIEVLRSFKRRFGIRLNWD